MNAFFYLLCMILIFFTNVHSAFSEEVATQVMEQPKAKEPKVLVLIIASDNLEAYINLQKVWKSYMHSDPEHFEVYFIRGNPELSTPYEIKGDDLFVKAEENYVPGITEKTVLSMEAMLSRLKEFDYVLRTNLSSFYVFERLLDFLQYLPKEGCYCGVHSYLPEEWVPEFGRIDYVSGAGILLSSDLAEVLVHEKEDIFAFSRELPDDVLFGYYFQNNSIPIRNIGRLDLPSLEHWNGIKDNIPGDIFHFRAKQHYGIRSAQESFDDELYIDLELLKIFYPSVVFGDSRS